MSKNQFTPGKWRKNPCRAADGVGNAIEIEADGQTIALIHPCEEMEANAGLFYSAPDLLAALEHCLCYLEADSDDAQERKDHAEARAAIAKAKGTP